MRILITSASQPAALAVARVLHAKGHTVHGADTERIAWTSPARYSRAYSRFYGLNPMVPFHAFWESVSQDFDLWIPFDNSEDAETVSNTVAESDTGPRIVYAPLFADKKIFQDFVRERVNGSHSADARVRVPLAFDVPATEQVLDLVLRYPGRKFEVGRVPYEGDLDYDSDTLVAGSSRPPTREGERAVAPAVGESEETIVIGMHEPLNEKFILDGRQCRLTERMEGGTYYEATCLVGNGEMKTIVVTTREQIASTTEILMTGTSSMEITSVLWDFMREFISAYGDYRREKQCEQPGTVLGDAKEGKEWSAHVSVLFHVREEINSQLIMRITAVSCSNKPHEPINLLASQKTYHRHLVRAYTAPETVNFPFLLVVHPSKSRGLYSLPMVLRDAWSIVRLLRVREGAYWISIAHSVVMLLVCGWCFIEETWCWRDPMPAVVMWILVPIVERALDAWNRLAGCWSRGNDSKNTGPKEQSDVKGNSGKDAMALAYRSDFYLRAWTPSPPDVRERPVVSGE